LPKCTNVITASKREWINKMGAMKEIFTQIQDNSYNIGRNLIESSEEADLDQIKQSLRDAIKNSALALAFIAEMEN
jgi:hypothetical protein